jgi:uncharacterized protein
LKPAKRLAKVTGMTGMPDLAPNGAEASRRRIQDSMTPTNCASEIATAADADVLAAVSARAERLFAGAQGSHDWEHSLRVLRLCRLIGPQEGGDARVLELAAVLHDIGRCRQDAAQGRLCHAALGAELAAELLADLGLAPALTANVIHCIRSHRFRGAATPETVEARILFDADKLDAIGAVGVARAYLFAGEVGAMLHNPSHDIRNTRAYTRDDTGYREFELKLRHIKDRMLTGEGRRLAEARHRFMMGFFERLMAEIDGHC